ncbi:hypothetical protein KDL01_16765 [Actinospica durhamensis]|uniref:Uncharacterized protein n=1 Tax=Actinospica durhamensis TaxID=1508375 RepID=A0A941ISI4_9ACTN|nr:hypothetical protein [Actinospica durhamensis]MBR7834928.1 hypothetical protein [Actinospica durhamensis]
MVADVLPTVGDGGAAGPPRAPMLVVLAAYPAALHAVVRATSPGENT